MFQTFCLARALVPDSLGPAEQVDFVFDVAGVASRTIKALPDDVETQVTIAAHSGGRSAARAPLRLLAPHSFVAMW